ncbi:MAG TPA: T9SS type A sorting domain-containing protein, partial [Candidatus Cloacimonadota bacterium]|nr:T9SS type A sorting domain-containing protein [Candidatus Cloacimonadota bacterium]
RSFTFYYGDQSCSMADSLLLGSSGQVTTYYSSALGDVNGDGYADFLSFIDKIWLGSSPVSNTPSLLLDYGNFLNFEYGMWPAIVHGDFNGDGFEDFAASDNWYAGDSGQAGIWLGKQNMNGTRDLSIDPPANYRFRNFGWSKAAGDFNGDGYCDLAFSAPIWTQGHTWNTAGKVFIYAGNALLSDTTVANEDEVLPPPQLSIRVFPNPLQREEIVQMEIKTLSAPQGDQAILRIFNSRGQQVYHQEHITLSGKSTTLPLQLQDLTNGVYLCQLQHGHTVTTTKLTIMK